MNGHSRPGPVHRPACSAPVWTGVQQLVGYDRYKSVLHQSCACTSELALCVGLAINVLDFLSFKVDCFSPIYIGAGDTSRQLHCTILSSTYVCFTATSCKELCAGQPVLHRVHTLINS